ncbi:hypothetical protein SPBRAN_1005 [uncultured Candidatus Thioglobus sp.]|nr:hypothetical protein SPBRAN_1005 [uncultured Candidatus Thioglobus sp.]
MIVRRYFYRDLCINRGDYQYATFAELVILLKPAPAGFNKIAKWVKGGILMIIHIYVKVFY